MTRSKTRKRPLTWEEREQAFRIATRSLVHWYEKELVTGMTDLELEAALTRCLGIMGGCGGPGRMSIEFRGSGLRIWAARGSLNSVQSKPVFAGRATVAMARELYRIPDPSNRQMQLF
jgi:hypothetical protein